MATRLQIDRYGVRDALTELADQFCVSLDDATLSHLTAVVADAIDAAMPDE